jgi:large subunit ribosomal protein L4
MTSTATTERSGTVLRHTQKKERPAPVTRSVTRRNAAGHDLGSVDLEPTVFGLEPNRAVLHQVVTAQLAAARAGTQSTLTRAEVRGGGAKPFRQKGTGRARQGSSRSPSMSGGGVALGPKPRSYAQRTPKKMVRLALLSALSDRAEIGRVAVIDDWKITEPDTRSAVTVLRKLKLDGTVLVVLANDEIDVALSFRNLQEAHTTTFAELSAHDVVRADWLLFSDRTLPKAVEDLSGANIPPPVERVEEAADEAEATEAPKKRATRAKKAAPADAEAADDAEATTEPPKKRATRAKKSAPAKAEAADDTAASAEAADETEVTDEAAEAAGDEEADTDA